MPLYSPQSVKLRSSFPQFYQRLGVQPWKLNDIGKSPFSIGHTSSNGGVSLDMLVCGGAFFDEHPTHLVGVSRKKSLPRNFKNLESFLGPLNLRFKHPGPPPEEVRGDSPKTYLNKNSKEVFGCLVLGVFCCMFRLVDEASKKEHPRHSTLAMGLAKVAREYQSVATKCSPGDGPAVTCLSCIWRSRLGHWKGHLDLTIPNSRSRSQNCYLLGISNGRFAPRI